MHGYWVIRRFGIMSIVLLMLWGCNQEKADDSSDSASEPEIEESSIVLGGETVPAGVKTKVSTNTNVTFLEEEEEEAPAEDSTPTAAEDPNLTRAATPTTQGLFDSDVTSAGMHLVSTEGNNVAAAMDNRSFPISLKVAGVTGLPPAPGTKVVFSANQGFPLPGTVETNESGVVNTDIFIRSLGSSIPRGFVTVSARLESSPGTQRDMNVFLSGPIKTYDIEHLYVPVDGEHPTANEKFGQFLVRVSDNFGQPLSDGTTLSCMLDLIPSGETDRQEIPAVFVNSSSQFIPTYALNQEVESIVFQNFTTVGPGKTEFVFSIPESEEQYFLSAPREALKDITCSLITANFVESAVQDAQNFVASNSGGGEPPTLLKTLPLEIQNHPAEGRLALGISSDSDFGYNAPLYGGIGYDVSLIMGVADANGNPASQGTQVRLSTTSGIVPEFVRTDSNGEATTTFSAGPPSPSPEYTSFLGLNTGEVRITASVEGEGGTPIETSIVILWSTGIGRLCFDPAAGNLDVTTLRIEDHFGNPLAQGTSLRCEGELETISRTTTQAADGTSSSIETPMVETVSSNFEDFLFGSYFLRDDEAIERFGLQDEPQIGRTAFQVVLPPPDPVVAADIVSSEYRQVSCTVETENGTPGTPTSYKVVITSDGRGNICSQ